MPRSKIDKQSTWHCSFADSDTSGFFNLSIKDGFQTELKATLDYFYDF
jgi:hypothetical protein